MPGTERPTQPVAPPGPEEEGARAELLERGSSVGRYHILQHLASGGMGAVYAAYDPQLDRRIALKVLASGLGAAHGDEDRLQRRLQREAQAMARLAHPNVVAVHDVGAYCGRVFLTMEFVDGVTLRAWLKAEKRGWREIRDIFVQAGRGLAAAHAVGLIHRDFKPENVLIGKDGRARVADFGLARPATVDPATEDEPGPSPTDETPSLPLLKTRLTQDGAVVGTLRYMAPEQMRAQPSDARTDQFSFALALYEALYGVRAFKARHLPARCDDITRGSIQPPKPGHGVPDWLEPVLRRSLGAEPAARYPSMDALLDDLQRDARKARLGARGLAAVAAVAVAAVSGALLLRPDLRCTGGTGKLGGAWDGDRRRAMQAAFLAAQPEGGQQAFDRAAEVLDRYASRWASMHDEACAATHIRKEQTEALLALRTRCLDLRLREMQKLTALFTEANAALVQRSLDAAHGLSELKSCADASSLADLTPLPQSPAERERIRDLSERLAEVNAVLLAGDYTAALEKAGAAQQEARQLGYRPLEAESLLQKGRAEARMGRWQESAEAFKAAVHASDAARMDALRARAATHLVYVAAVSDAFAAGHDWAAVASSAIERMGGAPELEGQLLANVGTLLASEGEPEQAVGTLERARQILGAELGREHPRYLFASADLANAYNGLRRYAESLELGSAMLAALRRAQGADHPALIPSLRSLAVAQAGLGQFAAAHASVDEALRIARARLGPEHQRVADCLDVKATAFQQEGRFAESLALYRASLEMKRKLLRPFAPDLFYSHDGIGQSLLGLGRAREAVLSFRTALSFRGIPGGDRADSQFGLARALWLLGEDRDASIRSGDEALGGYRAAKRPDQVQTVEAWLAARR